MLKVMPLWPSAARPWAHWFGPGIKGGGVALFLLNRLRKEVCERGEGGRVVEGKLGIWGLLEACIWHSRVYKKWRFRKMSKGLTYLPSLQ